MTGLRCEWVASALSMPLDLLADAVSIYSCSWGCIAESTQLLRFFPVSILQFAVSQRPKMLGHVVPNYNQERSQIANFFLQKKKFGREMFQ